MNLQIHLNFNGNCEDAFLFYKSALGGEIITLLRYGDSPAAASVSPNMLDKIVHATLKLDEFELAGADVPREEYGNAKGFQLILQLADEERAREIFTRLAEGGVVQMALQKTFWSPCYGMLRDKFGISWEINVAPADPETTNTGENP